MRTRGSMILAVGALFLIAAAARADESRSTFTAHVVVPSYAGVSLAEVDYVSCDPNALSIQVSDGTPYQVSCEALGGGKGPGGPPVVRRHRLTAVLTRLETPPAEGGQPPGDQAATMTVEF